MPFSKTADERDKTYWTEHYEKFLKPLIEENDNLSAYRMNELRGDILIQIITELVTSPIVVADLTDMNPNVFWELGIRQSFKHGTITIAEENTKLPFDLSSKRTIFYKSDKYNDKLFRTDFHNALQDCIDNPDRPDSHVLSTLSGRGSLFELYRKDETLRRIKALLDDVKFNKILINDFFKKTKYTKYFLGRLRKTGTAPMMRLSSIELLITNRYIDADNEFYEMAVNYYNFIKGMNLKLEDWSKNPKQIEKILHPIERALFGLSDSFEKNLLDLKSSLVKKL